MTVDLKEASTDAAGGGTNEIDAYERLADECRHVLQTVAARIPRLESPHPRRIAFVRAHRTVPKEFITAMIDAVEGTEELRSVRTFDSAAAREALDFIDAFRPLRDELSALLHAVTFTLEARKAEIAAAALRTYEIAKGLARDPNCTVTSHIERLQRGLHRSGRRREKTSSPLTADENV